MDHLYLPKLQMLSTAVLFLQAFLDLVLDPSLDLGVTTFNGWQSIAVETFLEDIFEKPN